MTLGKNDTILILSHYYKRAAAAGGPPQELRDFLVPKVKSVVYIEHPFPYADDHRSSATFYEDGRKVAIRYTPALAGPQFVYYLADIFLTWYFLLIARRRFTLCVALDNLNTISVWPARLLGQIKQLVFYTIDYSPQRFTNRLMNWLYHVVDRWACRCADTIWVLSERMVVARKSAGIDSPQSRQSVIVPMGANLSRIKRLPIEKIEPQQLIFVGHLLEKQGLQLVIAALPKILAAVPNAKVVVIGQGEHEPQLRKLADKLAVRQAIDWQGFVESHERVEEILCQSAIGLAPYIPSENNYTYFTDPGKPKLYLGCGLPVIITDVPASAQLIEREQAGIIIKPDAESIAEAIIKLLTDRSLYRTMRENAINLGKGYDTNTILERAIRQTGHDETR